MAVDNKTINTVVDLHVFDSDYKLPLEQKQKQNETNNRVNEIFFKLIMDAWQSTGHSNEISLQTYLAKMLSNFMTRPKDMSMSVAYQYFLFMTMRSEYDVAELKDIADVSLIVSAVFPERLNTRRYPLNIQSCADIAISGYSTLYERESENSWLKKAYFQLSSQFDLSFRVLSIVSQNMKGEKFVC